MVVYDLKLIHEEDDTLHLALMKHNTNAYPREENNCSDDSIMFLPDDRHMCDIVISKNTDLSSNKNFEIIYSILYSLNIGCEKYRI